MSSGPIELFKNGVQVFDGEASPAPGSGSTPGAPRWIGPYDFGFADVNAGGKVLGPMTEGDLILGMLIVLDTAFNDSSTDIDLSLFVGNLVAFDGTAVGTFVNIKGITPSPDSYGNNQALDVQGVQGSGQGEQLIIPVLVGVGAEAYVYPGASNGDGDAGSARLYLSIATPEVPA